MRVSAQEGGGLVASLASEPGFARLDEPETPVLIWRGGDELPAWSSEAGRGLLARLPSGFDGAPRLPPGTASRLRLLAGGLAPRTGMRLERLRWGRLEAPLVFACRLVTVSDEELLLTALLPPPRRAVMPAAARPPEPGLDKGASEGADEPSASSVRLSLPGARGRRFAWRADPDGRFSFVSPDLAEVVGARGAQIVGWRWEDLVGRLVDDRDGAVGGAWMRGESWSRRSVGWRNPESAEVIPVELSGAPATGPAGVGYRGFGIAFVDRASAAAPGAFLEPPEIGPVQAETFPVVQSVSEPEDRAENDVSSPPGTPADGKGAGVVAGDEATTETMFDSLRDWLTPRDAPPREAESFDPDGAEPGRYLSDSEQGALREIARTLRHPPDDEPRIDGAAEERPTAEIVLHPRARFRAEPSLLLDQLPIGVVVLREGVPIFANRSILRLLGFSELPEAVARETLLHLAKLRPDDALPETVSLTGTQGDALVFEARTARVEWGELGADLVLLTPSDGAAGVSLGPSRAPLDARERRLDEASAALDLAADGVVTLDRAGRLLSLNRAAERLFGVSARELLGDSITALIEPRDHRAVLSYLDAVRAGGGSSIQRCEVLGRVGAGAFVSLAMRAGLWPRDEQGFLIAFSDVTHFRLLERDLSEARVSAEAASANRADFLARISHELRTPLTAITGFAELMLEERFGPLGNERYKGYIRDIQDSGQHVISLVNDLLDLAKATSGAEELRPVPVDLNAVVQQCVALTGPLAGREKTIIRTSFLTSLPQAVADERSVRQIVINLLSNAIRYAGAGGQVIVSTAMNDVGEIVLSVRDTGPGMTEAEVETALTPFRQVPNTRRGDGTGLGLPLSKALTEANRGVFTITSARDLGTLVEVRLPAERHSAVAAE